MYLAFLLTSTANADGGKTIDLASTCRCQFEKNAAWPADQAMGSPLLCLVLEISLHCL